MKKKPSVIRTANMGASMMDWEDNMMEWDDLPTLSWSEVLKMENNREKVKRWRRAKVQRQALLQSLEKKSQETIAVTHKIGKGGWEKSGSIDAKKHRINWRLSVDNSGDQTAGEGATHPGAAELAHG